jgi:hypothetical protein
VRLVDSRFLGDVPLRWVGLVASWEPVRACASCDGGGDRGTNKLISAWGVREACENVKLLAAVSCAHCEHADDVRCVSWACVSAAVSSAKTVVLYRSVAIAALGCRSVSFCATVASRCGCCVTAQCY